MKRLVTIQDISCFGKCSQTVALPIISALGIETVLLPTAILSTHTGNFKDYTFLSLEGEIPKIIEHWKNIKIKFNAIYVGYIGNLTLLNIVSDFIDYFADKNTFVYIDPAMADNGTIYSGLDENYAKALGELCKKASVISPNIYEAMLLSGFGLKDSYSSDDGFEILSRLSNKYNDVIVTGIHNGDKIMTLGKRKSESVPVIKENTLINGTFYGAGDVFASVCAGTYLNGSSFKNAINFADDFVSKCILNTLPEIDKYSYGINYESCMGILCDFKN